MTYRVKMGISTLTAEQLVAKAQHIETNMTDNPNYPTPTPTVEQITTARQALETANANAIDGGRMVHAIKRNAEVDLSNLLRRMADYVQLTSDGDEEKILSSGYETRRRPEPVGQLPAPSDLFTRVSDIGGAIELGWRPVSNSRSYNVFINDTDPNNDNGWMPVHNTTKSRALITDLQPAKFYWFKVSAVGTAGESGTSDPARGLAA